MLTTFLPSICSRLVQWLCGLAAWRYLPRPGEPTSITRPPLRCRCARRRLSASENTGCSGPRAGACGISPPPAVFPVSPVPEPVPEPVPVPVSDPSADFFFFPPHAANADAQRTTHRIFFDIALIELRNARPMGKFLAATFTSSLLLRRPLDLLEQPREALRARRGDGDVHLGR